jgi:predicted DNA-binding transcriptional regulator YafY
MRRAERLFQIIQILRRAKAPTTAAQIAGELETSLRTVYRDIAELLAQRVPIRGEAGVGYALERGFDMPPLMLTPDEIEAAVLGAQWVMARGDPQLGRAAADLIAKIDAVIPQHLRPFLADASLSAYRPVGVAVDVIDVARLRAWIHSRGKIAISYRDEEGRETGRVIWPIAIGYFEAVRLVAAWCELRQDFRHFRTDRIVQAEFLEERYPAARRALHAAWKKTLRPSMRERRAVAEAAI